MTRPDRRARTAMVGAVVVVTLFASLAPLAADDITLPEAVERVDDALDGVPDALEDVDAIDGRAFDPTLFVGDDADTTARLRGLRAILVGGVDRPADLDSTLDRILDEPRFGMETSNPLRELFDRVVRWIGQRFQSVIDRLGGTTTAGVLGLAVMLVFAVFAGTRISRARGASVERRSDLARLVAAHADPRDVEEQADTATARGDHTTAVRLRFIAGLLRLDQAGVITFTPGLTSSEVHDALMAEGLDGDAFDAVHRDFDLVVYGSLDADASMDERAKVTWERIVRSTRVPS